MIEYTFNSPRLRGTAHHVRARLLPSTAYTIRFRLGSSHYQGEQMPREARSPQLVDRLMENPAEIIAVLRNHAVNATLFALTVVGLPALAASLYRAKDVGWHTVM